jgi:hypothetical protein
MALDFLIIQAMSAEYKKIFSAAGKIVIPERNKLKVETIAICQIFRLKFAASIIKNLNADPKLL